MAKFTTETEFPRSWDKTIKDLDGKTVSGSVITQPYLLGLYVAMNIDTGNIMQFGVPWSNFATFFKALKTDKNVSNLVVRKLGDFMTEEDIDSYLNS